MVVPHAASLLLPGALLAEKYRIERELGRGGMGIVYLARHVALDQSVAIKVLVGRGAEDATRFLREARAAAKLGSEHVARVTDVGAAEGIGPYMVMEYLVGSDLGQVLATGGPLSLIAAVDAIVEAAEALAEAHASGIVHRDLKPANLFLARRSDGTEVIKIIDFGISKITELTDATPVLTQTRALMGSPYYMAPEQLRSARDVDGRADVWSLGVALYELLSGRRPFQGATMGAVFARVLETSPPPLSRERADVPVEVSDAVDRCLQRDPNERFQHMGELALTLAPFGSARAHAAAGRACSFPTFPGRPASIPAGAADSRASSRQLPETLSERRSVRLGPLRIAALGALVIGVGVALVGIGFALARRGQSAGRANPSPPVAALRAASAPVTTAEPAVTPLSSDETAVTPVAPSSIAGSVSAPSASAPSTDAAPPRASVSRPRPRKAAGVAPSSAPSALDLDRRR